MANVGEIKAKIILENNDFRRKMRDSRTELEQTSRSAQSTAKSFQQIQQASLAVGTAVAASIGASVKVAADFEASMSKLGAVSNASADDLSKLEKAARDMGATTQFSATEAADALTYLAMAGFKVEDQIEALPSVLNAAAAGGIDLARASDLVSNIMTGFGISAEGTSEAVDVLVKTMTTANTDLPMLAEAMKYVAPVAKSLGLSLEETAAAVAKMSDAGIQGSNAGTALRAALLSLANPTGQTADAMEALNIQVTDANGGMKPLPELIGHIGDKLKGMTDAQKTATAAQLVGTEAASGFVVLLNQGEDGLKGYIDQLENAEGTADRVAKTMQDNLNGAFKEFQSSLEELGITVGQEFLPVFTEIVKTGADIVRNMSDMDGATVKAGLAFAGTAAGIALTATTIGKLTVALRTLSLSMGPAGWLITGLSVIGGLLVGASTHTKALNEAALDNIKTLQTQNQHLDDNVEAFDSLNAKLKLSSDELARFVDINSLLKQTSDPTIIRKLKDEQEKLQEKSGLTNEEMQKFIDANNEIIQIVPESTVKITEQGNALLESSGAAKEFSAETMNNIKTQLELQKVQNESKYIENLEEQERILKRIQKFDNEKEAHLKKRDEITRELNDQERILNGMLGEREKYSEQEIKNQQFIVKDLEDSVRLETERAGKAAERVLTEQETLDGIQKELKNYEKINEQLIKINLAQVGITAEANNAVEAVDEELSKLRLKRTTLDNNTAAAAKNTSEYQDAVKEIDKQITELNTVKSRIQDITTSASGMNRELAKVISKTVTVNYTHNGNNPQAYHTGGLVGRGQMPKLHTGGLASRFSSAPLHNEVDVRLLRNEMVLTEAQQANLMRMIDAGFTKDGGSDNPQLERLINQLSRNTEKPVNITLEVDGREMANVTYPYITRDLHDDLSRTMRGRGYK